MLIFILFIFMLVVIICFIFGFCIIIGFIGFIWFWFCEKFIGEGWLGMMRFGLLFMGVFELLFLLFGVNLGLEDGCLLIVNLF